jgi:TonB-dependent starch-binding outer membrane protein SusC
MTMRKLYKKVSLTALLALFVASITMAQERIVSGTVTDDQGSGMPGVNVLVKGTNIGTATSADGTFRLSVPNDQAVLVVSFIGYSTKEVTVGSQSNLSIAMDLDVTALQEVVVTGYTTDQRKDVTGAVATVKSKALTVVPSGNVEQQLQGRVPGVTVITNGQPGTASQIRVRGFGSFGGNEPLYIVDGLPVTGTDFLNPDDIETTTVLKDAAAASIYGARAANGVIVYTTKKGSRTAKKLTVNYDGIFGFTDPGNGQEMLNPQEFSEWTWNALRNTAQQNNVAFAPNHAQFGTNPASPTMPTYLLVGGTSGTNTAPNTALYNVTDFGAPQGIYQWFKPTTGSGTDWYDEITRTAPLTRNTLGISGGTDNSRFYLGLGMYEQDGILKNQHLSRYSVRLNSEFDILKKLRFGNNLQFTYRAIRLLQGDAGGFGIADDESIVLTAFRMPSIIPVYDEMGGFAGTRAAGFNNPRNPVGTLTRQQNNRGFSTGAVGNVYLEFEPIAGLVIRSSFGGTYNSNYFWSYFAREYENSENNSAFTYNEGGGWGRAYTFTNTVNYKKTFDKHSLDLLLGQEALNTGKGRNINGTGLNPFSQDLDYITLSTTTAGSTRVVNSGYGKGVNFSSFFGRANYVYDDKYIGSFVLRRDGSSRFGSESRYGVFPAVSVGWRISSEGFMAGASSIVDDLKIRGGWGIMGNSNNVDPNNQYTTYTANIGNSSYPIGDAGAAEGFYRNRIGNNEARWEKAITQNIGFDGSFFGGKLDVVLDLWQKNTEDLLLQVPQTVENGSFAALPSVNIGKMVNKGVDLQFITRGDAGPLGYEVTLNGGFLHNEIEALSGNLTYITYINPGYRGINPIRNGIGHSISSFYGYKVVGLFQSASEVSSSPTQSGAAPGRLKFEDINGDGTINDSDRTFIGSPVPKFTGGLNFKFTYANFELESYMFLQTGNQIFNVSKWFTDFYPSFAGAAISARVKDSWTFANGGNTIPIFENISNFSTQSNNANSFYVENGGYFRMQNITLAYNLPMQLVSKLKMEKLRVFASTNNVFTITKYEGLDPSVGGNADTQFGIDVGNYPITRSFTFGLNLGF